VFSKNADVLPTFLIDGTVAGTWDLGRDRDRDRDGDALRIELRPFARLARTDRTALEEEAARVLELIAPSAASREIVLAST
jgi:hypothetical protein